MFKLNVHSINGTCSQLQVGPDTTVATLKKELERPLALPEYYEVKLYFGTQELIDDTPVALDLHAVNTVSLDKIMATINDWATGQSKRALGEIHEAVALLGTLQDLRPAACRPLLDILFEKSENCMSDYDFNMGVGVGLELAKSFGRACGDPEPYIPGLLDICALAAHDILDICALAALAEIAFRSPETLRDRSAEICQICFWGISLVPVVSASCYLLGEYGDTTHKPQLNQIAQYGDSTDGQVALAALERIAAREVTQAAAMGHGSHTLARVELEEQQRHETLDLRQPDEIEQDVKLRLAFQMDEAEVLEREGADLAEAIVRSKLDAVIIDNSTDQQGEKTNEDALMKAASATISSSCGAAPTSSVSAPSSKRAEVVPTQASLQNMKPHMVDGKVPSIGTVTHNNGCNACRNMARGGKCKFGTVCEFCHAAAHQPAETARQGGRTRQRQVKRGHASSWCRPATPDSFEES